MVMSEIDTAMPVPSARDLDRVERLTEQARTLEAGLYTLFLDYDDCVRRGLEVHLPPAVAAAMLEWHPFAERMREKVNSMLQVLAGQAPEPMSAEVQNQATRRMWSLRAEDVPEIVLAPGHRTNVDWVVAAVASAPETTWTAAEVLEVLERSGWSTTSPNPQNLVANALNRAVATHPNLVRCGRGSYRWQLAAAAEDLTDREGSPDDFGRWLQDPQEPVMT